MFSSEGPKRGGLKEDHRCPERPGHWAGLFPRLQDHLVGVETAKLPYLGLR